jgi:hypothetical protein
MAVPHDAPGHHAAARPRPAPFRALGAADPPATITLDGETFRRVEILKHDSWAATAVYRSATRTAIKLQTRRGYGTRGTTTTCDARHRCRRVVRH